MEQTIRLTESDDFNVNMKDLLWINRWDGRRKNSAKEKQNIGQGFISNYNITDFKQVLSELWVGLAMNTGSENSRYVTFIPPTANEVIKLRMSDHPSNENEWGEKELTGLPDRRYSIVIFSSKSMPSESNKDVKHLPWRSYSAQNIPVHEIAFNRFYLIETFSLLKTILETIYNGGSPEKTTNNVSENKQLKSNNSMKQTIRLTESDLKHLISESVKKVMKESERDIDDDSYYGGGLPEQKPQAHTYNCEKEVMEIYNKIKPYIDQLADIFNDNDYGNREVYEKVMDALETLDSLPSIGKQFYSTEIDEFNGNY